ncbi:MAG: phosphotransferase family protein, partial [Actinomycetales bacterium]
ASSWEEIVNTGQEGEPAVNGLNESSSLTGDAARRALAAAAKAAGVDASSADLLGPVGDNAVFGLPGGVVARVSSPAALPRVARELCVARWLESLAFPAVRVWPSAPDVIETAGGVVAFWVEIPGIRPSAPGDLGGLLRRLHTITSAPAGVLAPFEPFARISDHIRHATGLSAAERDTLHALLDDLTLAYDSVQFERDPCVIHGDAHRKNIVADASGAVVMLDLEHLSRAAPEWDLTVAAVYRRVGWYSEPEYQEFVDAYGWDVTTWQGFPVMAAIRQLRMTAWLAARTDREPRLIPQVRARLASLVDGTAHAWEPGR